jgi:stress-induced morphogen
MPVTIHGTTDPVTERVATALRSYADAHGAAEVSVHRDSPVSVRVRVIDPDFRDKSRSERHKTVWPLLYPLDEDTLAELTMLLLITPEEEDTSLANQDFKKGLFHSDLNRVLKPRQTDASAESSVGASQPGS